MLRVLKMAAEHQGHRVAEINAQISRVEPPEAGAAHLSARRSA
jgi:hypothetical protein